jgi:hypothetical protein
MKLREKKAKGKEELKLGEKRKERKRERKQR